MAGETPRLPGPAEEVAVRQAEALLGHTFGDPGLLAAALTHPSYTGEQGSGVAFQRLELLGDSVLDLIVVEELYRRFSASPEGDLTKLKVTLVSGPTLAEVMRETGLDALVLLGASELRTGGRGLTSALADCFEAVLAAMYLDDGFRPARSWALSALGGRIEAGPAGAAVEHPKSALQEFTQARGAAPVYETLAHHGPPHDRRFLVRVTVDGAELGRGEGRSKKEAEMQAAAEALRTLRDHA